MGTFANIADNRRLVGGLRAESRVGVSAAPGRCMLSGADLLLHPYRMKDQSSTGDVLCMNGS